MAETKTIEKRIAVICFDVDDFREWKHLKGHANYMVGTYKKYQVDDTIYYGISKVTDLCSLVINDIKYTQNAHKNPEYDEIVRVALSNLFEIKPKKGSTLIKGFIPYGAHKEKGVMYFSNTRQKWVNKIGKIKIGDILSTPTVPIVNPKKTLKNIHHIDGKPEVGVSKIEITIEL